MTAAEPPTPRAAPATSGDPITRRKQAEEMIAERFTRVMNATPSRYGVLSDIGFAAVATGVVVIAGLFVASRLEEPAKFAPFIFLLAALPIVIAVTASLALRGSRAKVLDWMATVPFPIENLNSLLAGMGDTIEVVFAEGAPLPSRAKLQPELDAVSEDTLLVAEKPEQSLIEIRLGIIDSKRNPLPTNHRRFRRLQQVIERVLVPLSESTPIVSLRIV